MPRGKKKEAKVAGFPDLGEEKSKSTPVHDVKAVDSAPAAAEEKSKAAPVHDVKGVDSAPAAAAAAAVEAATTPQLLSEAQQHVLFRARAAIQKRQDLAVGFATTEMDGLAKRIVIMKMFMGAVNEGMGALVMASFTLHRDENVVIDLVKDLMKWNNAIELLSDPTMQSLSDIQLLMWLYEVIHGNELKMRAYEADIKKKNPNISNDELAFRAMCKHMGKAEHIDRLRRMATARYVPEANQAKWELNRIGHATRRANARRTKAARFEAATHAARQRAKEELAQKLAASS
jgi:hypothetical protein